jgi:8-oxo-dGTP pyrophosphatase MutT (NUDIX family)
LFFAGPKDVQKECEIAREAVSEWNINVGSVLQTRFELVHWTTHTSPEIGKPQAIINRQALDSADALLGIFWSRFGEPTGQAQSGTEEEIRRSIRVKRPVLLYFCERRPPKTADTRQLHRVHKFKREFRNKGLYATYNAHFGLRLLLSRHLTRTAQTLPQKAGHQTLLTVAVGVVQRGKDVLLVRRRVPEGTDGSLRWQFPAGMIKPKEAGEHAVIEEVREETGIQCKVVDTLGSRIHPDTHTPLQYYLCSYLSGRAKNRDPNENTEVKWINVRRIRQYITSDLFNKVEEALGGVTKGKLPNVTFNR